MLVNKNQTILKQSLIHLGHAAIDRNRWNECIENSPQGRIYAMDWYLDIVTDGKWNALVLGDYEAVMPLPFHRKAILLPAVYQPLLCQQLGIFAKQNHTITVPFIKDFLNNIPKKYWKVTVALNDGNTDIDSFDMWTCRSRVNLVLPLSQGYTTLQSNFSNNLKRCLKKATNEMIYTEMYDNQLFIKEVTTYLKTKENHIPSKVYLLAERIMQEAIKRKKGFLAALLTPEGALAAAIFYLNDGQRLINLLNVTTTIGKDAYAMHKLTDLVIEKHSNQNILMDFEGSSIDSIARFYKGFGAKEKNYLLFENSFPIRRSKQV